MTGPENPAGHGAVTAAEAAENVTDELTHCAALLGEATEVLDMATDLLTSPPPADTRRFLDRCGHHLLRLAAMVTRAQDRLTRLAGLTPPRRDAYTAARPVLFLLFYTGLVVANGLALAVALGAHPPDVLADIQHQILGFSIGVLTATWIVQTRHRHPPDRR